MTTHTQQTKARTAGPWVVDEVNTTFVAKLVGGVYHYICAVEPADFSTDDKSREENEANAAFIVQACNAHDDLVAALAKLMHLWDTDQIFPANLDTIDTSVFSEARELLSRTKPQTPGATG